MSKKQGNNMIAGSFLNAIMKGGMAKTTVRFFAAAVAICVAVLGSVVASAAPLTLSGTFNHSAYLTVSATANNDGSSVVLNGNDITATAKTVNTGTSCKPNYAADTVTVTVANNTTATIQYDIAVSSNVSGVTAGTALQLAPGASFTFTVASAASDGSTVAGTVTLTNVSPVSTGQKVTTVFKATAGGKLFVDNGEEPITGTVSMEYASDHEYVIEAVADTGYKFIGWFTELAGMVSTETTMSYRAIEGSTDTIWASFAPSDSAVYKVGASYYGYLDEAITAASSGDGLVTVYASGVTYHSKGENGFTIPSNVKLLVPYSATDTGLFKPLTDSDKNYYFNGVSSDKGNQYTNCSAPTPYVTLTIPDGVTVTCDGGAISLSSTMYVNNHYSISTGHFMSYNGNKVGYIQLNGNLVLQNSAKLYCYGVIYGNGTVTAENTAHVYEFMEVADYVGADNMNKMRTNTTYLSFPFSQYYIANIECAYVIKTGASSHVIMGVGYGGGQKITEVAFIGTDSGLFRLSGNGSYLLRKYVGSEDRMYYEVHGTMSVESMTVGLLKSEGSSGGIEVNSADYVMQLNGDSTVRVTEDSYLNINKSISLSPEAKIIVDYKGTCNVATGAKLYLYDREDWHAFGFNYQDVNPKKYAVTRTYTRPGGAAKDISGRTENDGIPYHSACLEVNGTLNMHGNVFATFGVFGAIATDTTHASVVHEKSYDDERSMDKVIVGTGTIVNDTAWATDNKLSNKAMWHGSKKTMTQWLLYTEPAVAHIAGVDTAETYSTFGTGTYTGVVVDDVNYWTQNTITVEGEITPVQGSAEAGIANGMVSDGGNPTISGLKIRQNNYVLSATTGTFSFTVEEGKSVEVNGEALTPGEDGVYTVTNAGGDVVITVGEAHVHEEEIVPGTPATCTTPGMTDGVICKTCEDVLVEQEEIEALGHTEKPVEGYDATCTVPGLTDGVICKTCKDVLVEQKEIPAPDHEWVPATFDAPKSCKNCDATEGEAKVAVAKVGEERYETLAEAVEKAGDNDTIIVLKDIFLADDVVLDAGSKTIDFAGNKVRGNVFGTLKLNNGTLITVQDYEMAGPNGTYYKTEDAIFTMDTSMNIVVLAGTIELAQDWWTLAGQSLTIGEEATFVIPDGLTLQVLSTVVVDGTVSGEGVVNLYSSDATITTANANMTNIVTTAGETVWYTDGKYAVHNHEYDEGEVTIEVTCTVAGEKIYTCVCGEAYTEEIPALNHEGTETTTVTEQIEGTETHETITTCECGYELNNSGAVPCEDTDKNGECDTCHGVVIVGTTVNGKILAYNGNNAPVVKLYADGVEKYTVEAAGAIKSGNQYVWNFELTEVVAGVYDLVVTKAGHASYTITGIQVGEEPVDLTTSGNAAISTITMLCGDIDGNGWINSTDLGIILKVQNYGKQTTANGANQLADLDGNGWINSADLTILLYGQHYGKSKITVPFA